MPDFDPKFEIDVTLVLAEAAYDLANGVPPKLPGGYVKVADIIVDMAKMALHAAEASASQHKLFSAMMLVVQKPEIFGFIAQNGNTAAIVFRGTVRPEEWLKDFDFIHVPFEAVPGFGEVHQGFQFVYDSVRDSTMAGLAKCGARGRTLIAGHSLGAALTLLCAPDVAVNAVSGPAPEVHSYAGPRAAAPDLLDPLNSTYAANFDKKIQTCFRIVNHWDIVPHLPPSVSLYQHVGTGVSVDGGFTLDLARAHSLQLSYLPGLQHLSPQEARTMHAAAVS